MPLDVVVGAQWGDEGKGKVAAYLARGAESAARFQGGPNAGHTLWAMERPVVFRMVPAGIVTAETGVIGAGCVLDPVLLAEELRTLEQTFPGLSQRLAISTAAHLIHDGHLARDRSGTAERIGTTGSGVGPAYSDKVARNGVRIGDLLRGKMPEQASAEWRVEAWRFVEDFGHLCIDTGIIVRETLAAGGRVVAEGAQGALLDLDHGDYPYVTSSTTTAAAAFSGLGVPPRDLGRVILVASAYTTKVGGGPFPSRLEGELARQLQSWGQEIDGATDKLRDCGWLDAAALRRATALNAPDGLVLTRLDVLGRLGEVRLVDSDEGEPPRTIWRGRGWQIGGVPDERRLSSALRAFVEAVEKTSGLPVVGISHGPRTEEFLPLGATVVAA